MEKNFKINIYSEKESVEDMVEMLREIADNLEVGFIKGSYPKWDLEEVCRYCGGTGKVEVLVYTNGEPDGYEDEACECQ